MTITTLRLLAAAGLLSTSAASVAQLPATVPGNGAVPASATAHPLLWPKAHSPAAMRDGPTEARIGRMIAAMTLEQKVGQTIQADISTITPADLAAYPLGSILAGGNSGPYGNERASGSQWARLVREFRTASANANHAAGVAIPVLFGVDAVHGHSNLPGATIFPHNIGLGAAHDPDLIRRIGAATAAEVSATGIEWTFAPTVTVPQDLRWGRSYEGYAADPALVAAYAGMMVRGLQGELVQGRPIAPDHVAASVKHFVADGGTAGGKDQGDALVDEKTLIATHAQGYPAAIDAGVLTVMVSFSGWNGVKNHGNRSLLTDVLKGRMGFDGLVVGDWNAHAQIPGCTTIHCPDAINAGLDMYMAPDSWKGLYTSLLADVRSGRVPMARLDDAVRRILRVKAKLGLLDNARAIRDEPSAVATAAHTALAREAVAKSMVLLKNEHNVLPIRAGAKVLVTGDAADSMAMQAGGWTISWQGTDTTKADFPNGQTIWAGLRTAVVAGGGEAALSADGSFTHRPDVAIVVFGEPPYAEFQGDIPSLDLTAAERANLGLIKRLEQQGIPVVVVFLSGRPLFTSPEINAADAFVAGWLPGTAGAGIADVLVANTSGQPARDFTGRLSFPWPRDARSPVVDPVFAAGYGQSYARPAPVAVLSEDSHVDSAAQRNVADLFVAGHAVSPLTLRLTDPTGSMTVAGGAAKSPSGAVETRAIDAGAQENARLFAWTSAGSVAIEGPPADLTRELTEAFALAVAFDVTGAPNAHATIAVDGTALPLDLGGDRHHLLKIPLRCFAEHGAKLTAVTTPLRLASDGPLRLTLLSAHIVPVGEPLGCPG